MSVAAIVPVPARFAERPAAVLAAVAGLSPLQRVVRSLAETADVVVAVAEQLREPVRRALAGQELSAVRIAVADPPGERAQCIAAGLRELAGRPHVVLHDIEWPLVGAGVLDRIVATLRDGAVAVMPARPVTDSVKAVSTEGVVTATLDRSQLRTVQYPRGFAADVLASLMAHGDSAPFDELDAALSAGTEVTVIDGDDDALSVELPRDTDYLAALIEGRQDLIAD
ncbi:MAG: 2-C-methyl-D-erythritol 4-phosphate cytidylyltransferase [Mycobacterium sp.]|nr:2-C-methyl-D-erythritol 4-phosphate cytidylyltransferase [Mycobacterium sp.]